MAIRSYKDLDVWKMGMELACEVYSITKAFPADERFGLVSQLRRCSVSVPSNIAEGHARLSTKDFLRHISISLGSLAELETQLLLGQSLGYTTGRETEITSLLNDCDLLGKKLRSLTHSLQRKLG